MPEPLDLSNWDESDVRGLLLAHAIRHRALVELLIEKNVITNDELNAKANEVANTGLDRLIRDISPRQMPPS